MLRKDPLHCYDFIIEITKWKDFNNSLGFFILNLSVNKT